MVTRDRLFTWIAWITAGHLNHWQAQQRWLTAVGQFFMKQASPARWSHAEQVIYQQQELQELQALSACYELKRHARLIGGWQDKHGEQLDAVAAVLVLQHHWDPEEDGNFVEDLTEGHFMFAVHDYDDDDDLD